MDLRFNENDFNNALVQYNTIRTTGKFPSVVLLKALLRSPFVTSETTIDIVTHTRYPKVVVTAAKNATMQADTLEIIYSVLPRFQESYFARILGDLLRHKNTSLDLFERMVDENFELLLVDNNLRSCVLQRKNGPPEIYERIALSLIEVIKEKTENGVAPNTYDREVNTAIMGICGLFSKITFTDRNLTLNAFDVISASREFNKRDATSTSLASLFLERLFYNPNISSDILQVLSKKALSVGIDITQNMDIYGAYFSNPAISEELFEQTKEEIKNSIERRQRGYWLGKISAKCPSHGIDFLIDNYIGIQQAYYSWGYERLIKKVLNSKNLTIEKAEELLESSVFPDSYKEMILRNPKVIRHYKKELSKASNTYMKYIPNEWVKEMIVAS